MGNECQLEEKKAMRIVEPAADIENEHVMTEKWRR